MKFLILSTENSGECDSVAAAVSDAAQIDGIESLIVDPSAFCEGNEKAYKRLLQKIPGAMKVIRGAGRLYDKTHLPSPFNHSSFIKKMNECISGGGFDAVICTDKKSTELLSGYETVVPVYSVFTDFSCPDVKNNSPIEKFFVPHESVSSDLVMRGIEPDRISVTGIPIPLRFGKKLGKKTARNYLVIPQKKRVYLVITSGLSLGNAQDICDGLMKSEVDDFAVYLLTGRDSEIKDGLSERYRGNERIRIITFTEKVNVYMEAADAIISRPLGIVSAEAAASSLPLVHITSLTGRDRTADFFSSHEMALKGLGVRDAVKKASRLIENKATADRMRTIQKNNCPTDAAIKIVRGIIDCLNAKKQKATT